MPNATKIMVIRHAEKPGKYPADGPELMYWGVNEAGDVAGQAGAEHLTTLGWERAGALVPLFAPPWGPKPGLARPDHLFASDPGPPSAADSGKNGPSQRPYETLTALSAKLSLTIHQGHKKNEYPEMVANALGRSGAVLIAWQHEDIQAICLEVLKQTNTPADKFNPPGWPDHRYDLVYILERPSGEGPIARFTIVAQQLLAHDSPTVP